MDVKGGFQKLSKDIPQDFVRIARPRPFKRLFHHAAISHTNAAISQPIGHNMGLSHIRIQNDERQGCQAVFNSPRKMCSFSNSPFFKFFSKPTFGH